MSVYRLSLHFYWCPSGHTTQCHVIMTPATTMSVYRLSLHFTDAPVDTRRNNNIIMTSKRRHDVVWRHNDVIIALFCPLTLCYPGRHPRRRGDIRDMEVCASQGGQCCHARWYIRIANCGDFYTYLLHETRGCYQAYCVGKVEKALIWASCQIHATAGCTCAGNSGRESFPCHRGLEIPTSITARAWRTCCDACRDR